MTASDKPIRFQAGTIVATMGALQVADNLAILELLRRHTAGDWGEVSCDDAQANERAVRHGDRILSSYSTESGEKLWVLTESDRSTTTVMTPGEY